MSRPGISRRAIASAVESYKRAALERGLDLEAAAAFAMAQVECDRDAILAAVRMKRSPNWSPKYERSKRTRV